MFRGLYRRAVPYTSSRVLKRFRPSRGRAGVSLGLGGRVDGCEVRPFDPCARVRPCVPCVPCLSRVSRDPCGARVSRVSEITHRHTFTFTQSLHSRSRLPRCLFTGSRYRVQYRYPVLCTCTRSSYRLRASAERRLSPKLISSWARAAQRCLYTNPPVRPRLRPTPLRSWPRLSPSRRR